VLPAWRNEPERGSPVAMAFMTWLALVLGRTATRWLLVPICVYYYAFAPRSRSASRDFLARALARRPRMLDVLRHHHSFASTLHDRIFLVSGEISKLQVCVFGAEHVDRLLAYGRGCILVGSHLGSFEVLRALGHIRGKHVNVVMHEENAIKVRRTFSRLAPQLQERVIASGQRDTTLRVKECLERGEIVGILADRPLAGDHTAVRAFLGGPARFPLGPWLLAASLGVPVALFFGLYAGGARYEVEFEVLTDGERAPRERRPELAARLLERYVTRLEHYARCSPYNWFNFYDFWDRAQG
jgi:predicted LPLAT superfamily acyltransferase